MYSQLSCKRPPLMQDKVVAYKRRSSTGRIKKISSNVNTWRYYLTSLKLNIQFRIDVTIHLSPCRVFHSRGQHLCKFIGTKGGVCIRKELNSHRICLGHQHGRRFIILGHQYGRRDVMWKHSIDRTTVLRFCKSTAIICQHTWSVLLKTLLNFVIMTLV